MKKLIITSLLAFSITTGTSAQIPAPGFSLKTLPDTLFVPEKSAAPSRADAELEKISAMKLVNTKTTLSDIKQDATELTRDLSYTYDGFGALASVSNAINGATSSYEYEWDVPSSVWNKVSVKNYDAGGSLTQSSTQTRTYHSNGNVATAEYTSSNGSVYREEFDENGDCFFTLSTDGNGKGKAKFFFTGTIFNVGPEGEYEYFPDQHLVVYTNYSLKKGERNQLNRKEYYYHTAKGRCIASYVENYTSDTDDGDVYLRSASGSKAVFGPDGITITAYTLDDDKNIVPVAKTESSNNYYDPREYAPGFYIWEKRYECSQDGDWALTRDYSLEAINNYVVKTTIKYPEREEIGYWYVTNYGLLTNCYYNESNGYYGLKRENYNIETQYGIPGAVGGIEYAYYNEKCQQVAQIRNYNDVYWERYDDAAGEWKPCSGTMDFYTTGDVKATFDEKGRMITSEYSTNGVSFTDSYTYTDDGWMLDSRYTNGAPYCHREKFLVNDEYKFQEEYFKDGATIAGERHIADFSTFIWEEQQLADGKWETYYRRAFPSFEYNDDGITYTVIEHKLYDGDEKAGNFRKQIKSIDPSTYSYNESYNWNGSKWVGSGKGIIEYGPVLPVFDTYQAQDPATISKDYTVGNNDCSMYGGYDKCSTKQTVYFWNDAEDQWEWASEQVTEVRYSNDLKEQTRIETFECEAYSKYSRTLTAINDSHRIVRIACFSNEVADIPYQEETWTFDDDDDTRLLKHYANDGKEITVDTYTYALHEYYGSGIEEVSADNSDTISEIFSLAGIKVAETCGDVRQAGLPKGLYIVRQGTTARKIVL